jgi:hypothetical protein
MLTLQTKSRKRAASDPSDPDDADVERKTFTLEIKDEEKGQVEAVFSTFNVKDYHDDWTLPGAFGDVDVLIGSWGHGTVFGDPPVGLGTISETAKDARLIGQYFLDTFEGKEQFTTVKKVGPRQEWSYSYEVLETGEITEELREKGVRRVIKKAEVFEISPVMRGAGIRTRTVVAKRKAADPPVVDPPVADPPAQTAEETVATAADAQAAADQATREQKAVDDAAALERANAERATAELKARTEEAVEEFRRIQRTHQRLGLTK